MLQKGLARLVRKARRKNILKGLKVCRKEAEITIFQFADDTLLFGKPNYENILAIKSILPCFELLFGLKANFHKSQIGNFRFEDATLFQHFIGILIATTCLYHLST